MGTAESGLGGGDADAGSAGDGGSASSSGNEGSASDGDGTNDGNDGNDGNDDGSDATTAGDDGGETGLPSDCDPGDTHTLTCDDDGNDVTYTCDDAGDFVPTSTLFGCTVQYQPGAGTRVCPGEIFTRSCWPIAGGRARVDWRCDGTLDAAGGGFTEVDYDYCTAVSGPEAGVHFCPGEVITRDNCPANRTAYICPDTEAEDEAFVPEAVLSCNVETDEWEPLHRGVDLKRWYENGDRFRAVRIDLCDVSLRIAATESVDRGQRTSTWATSNGMLAAINGGFFSGGYAPVGIALGGGEEWPDSADSAVRSFMAFGPGNVEHSPTVAVETPPYPGFPWIEEAVNGDAVIVDAGVAQPTGATPARARTAVGYTEDSDTLYFATVDEVGGSSGMTVTDFGPILEELGAHWAINLDGGGSTSLYATGLGLVSSPSDGSERVVANHLGVYIEGGNVGYHCP